MAVSPLRLHAALHDADADRTRAVRLARELEHALAGAAPGPVPAGQRWTDAQVMALIAERDAARAAAAVPAERRWTDAQVTALIAERDAALAAALAALHDIAVRCHPHGVSPMVLRRGDPPWPRVADLLWGPAT